MRLTFPQIKTITKLLIDSGYTEKQSSDILKSSDDDIIQSLLLGDISCLESAPASSKGSSNAGTVSAPDLSSNKSYTDNKAVSVAVPGASLRGSDSKDDNIPASRPAASPGASSDHPVDTESPSPSLSASVKLSNNTDDVLPAERPSVLPAVDSDDLPGLPVEYADMIRDNIKLYCTQNNIDDMRKAYHEEWRGCCMWIGKTIIKPSEILLNKHRMKTKGGLHYNYHVLNDLCELWAFFCTSFRKAPLACDYVSFCGLGFDFLKDCTNNEGLSSERMRLKQKVADIQESGLAGGLVDGRKNPTGTIFFLKNWHGWRDQREVIHSTGSAAVGAGDLPVLGDNGTV